MLWYVIRSWICSKRVLKTLFSVLTIADSYLFPLVRFCEVTTETFCPDNDFTSSIFEWLSAIYASCTTSLMNCHRFIVFCVAFRSSRTVIECMLSDFFRIKYNLLRNSSEIEKVVIHTSDLPTCSRIHSRTSATWIVLVRYACVVLSERKRGLR